MEHSTAQLVGDSPPMRALIERIPVVARAGRTTLISGPTGSGKEVVAAALHRARNPRAPYIAVHCGAIPEQLMEAELFGHTRGAFTGALQPRPGLIKSAAGGTLFLDEIDSLSVPAQAKLLRFLESGECRAVGSDKTEHTDVWVIAATNKCLATQARQGSFREDLYYRLDVMRLDLPPLCARGRDVEVLAAFFLERIAPSRRFSRAALAAIAAYEWPGNVRELRHRVERAALVAREPTIEPVDMGLGRVEHTATAAAAEPAQVWTELWRMLEEDGLSLSEVMTLCERKLIGQALQAEDNNRTRAARRLGIHVRTIFKKLSQHGEPADA